MRAYFAEENPIKRDGIAVRQLRALREHQGPREKKLRLSDVKAMFAQMKDHTNFAGSSRRGHWLNRGERCLPDRPQASRPSARQLGIDALKHRFCVAFNPWFRLDRPIVF